MTEQLRENYFLAVRMSLLLLLEVYIVLAQAVLTGASGKVLLLLALFVGVVAGKALTPKRKKWTQWILFGAAVFLYIVIHMWLGKEFLLLGIFLCYELLSCIKPGIFLYLIPLVPACVSTDIGVLNQVMLTSIMGLLYIQHDFIVESYKKQTKEDTLTEQHLKKSMNEKEHALREEINQGLLTAENRLLEERAHLSQTLHDKLGHNINGSIYQLEAAKLLLEKDPETTRGMLQAVIDQLRTGMDEIRAILRKERPQKYKLAMLQLEKLCEDCNEKGVEARLVTEGDMSKVPEKYLEVILDNAFEAVSNSLKYAKCTQIEIKIHVLNRMIRCSISDNGVGCSHIVDGMGIAGMRRRIREINGILNFESEIGFTINMLLPWEEKTKKGAEE